MQNANDRGLLPGSSLALGPASNATYTAAASLMELIPRPLQVRLRPFNSEGLDWLHSKECLLSPVRLE